MHPIQTAITRAFVACSCLALGAACTVQTVNNYYIVDAGTDTTDTAPGDVAAETATGPADQAQAADLATADSPGPDLPAPTDIQQPDVAGPVVAADTAPDTKPDTAAIPIGPDDWPVRAFAPFVDATLYPVIKLADIAKETKQLRFVLGFVVAATATQCKATWGTYYSLETGPDSWDSGASYTLYDQIAAVRAKGGDVMVSFGGASSVPLHVACTEVTALTAQYQAVIDKLSLRRIDFDVEGTWVIDTKANTRNSQAIAAVQAAAKGKGKPIGVWFTLPVLPNGLTAEGVAIVDDALSNGVDIGGVNIMAMDYGDGAAPNPAGKMGTFAIDAAKATHAQLTTLWQKHKVAIPADGGWSRVGVTPMIGLNDLKTELFSLTDAKQLAGFAVQQGLGLLSMWSLNRDHPCADNSNVQLKCSSSPDQTTEFAFTLAFQQAVAP